MGSIELLLDSKRLLLVSIQLLLGSVQLLLGLKQLQLLLQFESMQNEFLIRLDNKLLILAISCSMNPIFYLSDGDLNVLLNGLVGLFLVSKTFLSLFVCELLLKII